ncbi:MAG: PQQ-binding-like beta-propeller repeat protein [Verrucomicrobia bacterium]|nr:PQQ-binding-like beta-propeller repeat protein [Verrucomicrobiota bacterium]
MNPSAFRLLAIALPGLLFSPVHAADWLQFRGPYGAGVADASETTVPVTFSPASVAWKVPLPGRGLSSPIVIADHVIVTCSSGPDQDRLHVFAIHAATGKVRWERRFRATGRTMTHSKTNVAAPTPCSDGSLIFALFSTNDLFCLDLEGNLRWLRGLTYDYPNASNSLGLASSPLIADNTLVVQSENDSESFVAGLSPGDGSNRWLKPRRKAANWTSALTLGGEVTTVALQSTSGILGIAPSTGSELWEYRDGASTIPSAALEGVTLYVPSFGMTALRSEGTTVKKIWRNEQARPKTSSPVAWKGQIYFPEGGVVTALQADTGERLWKTRVQGDFSASPVIANGHLYLFSESGTAFAIPVGPDLKEPSVAGQMELGEPVLCTPAISGGAIYVRSDAHLWKLATPSS